MWMTRKRVLWAGSMTMALALATMTSWLAAAAHDEDLPSVVVTTEVLGSIVDDLAGDAADVHTLMGGPVDPHSWQPSARDSQAIFEADLIVANGLDLEEGLLSVLDQAESDGVPVFHATDHVTIRHAPGAEDVHDAGDDHEQVAGDPHFWLDPMAMRDVVLALGPVLTDTGADIGDGAEVLAAQLEQLDAEIADILSVVPPERRQLVTGHSALGYFADRYGFRIVGTVVPGLSSSDEPSARDIAALVSAVREAGATAVFTDVGTPRSVAEAVANETGAQVVELQIAQLPEGGDYADLMRGVARAIASVLSAPADA